MDEPTSGLDPNQIIEVRQLIRELAHERTVILSTHILPEVEMTCNRVIIIHEGKIVAVDTPENLTADMRDTARFFVRVSGDVDVAAEAIARIEGVGSVVRFRRWLARALARGCEFEHRGFGARCRLGHGAGGNAGRSHVFGRNFSRADHAGGELMGQVMAIFGKEMRSYFGSPIAYVMAGVFLLFSGLCSAIKCSNFAI